MLEGSLMHSPSSRTIWFYTAVLAMIAFALFAVAPVSADVIQPITPTKVYFENNGTPVNEPVTFTVNCYGNHPSGSYPSPSKPSERENVFWFSATCPTYGCTIYQYYSGIEDLHINSCDLDGELNGEHFIIRNFANTPGPDCTSLHQGDACTLRFAIPPERYEPVPTPPRTPMITPHSYSYLPLPAYVVLVSLVLAGGLAVMIRKKRNS